MNGFAVQVPHSAGPMLAFAPLGLGMAMVHERWARASIWGLTVGTMGLFGGLGIVRTSGTPGRQSAAGSPTRPR